MKNYRNLYGKNNALSASFKIIAISSKNHHLIMSTETNNKNNNQPICIQPSNKNSIYQCYLKGILTCQISIIMASTLLEAIYQKIIIHQIMMKRQEQNDESLLHKFWELVQRIPCEKRVGLCVLNTNKRYKRLMARYKVEMAEKVLRIQLQRNNSEISQFWSQQDLQLLLFIVDKYCLVNNYRLSNIQTLNWSQISEFFPNKKNEHCMFKILSIITKKQIYTKWNQLQKQLFQKMISGIQFIDINWEKFSQQFYLKSPQKIYRLPRQLIQYYQSLLKLNFKRTSWTWIQDHRLYTLFMKYGRRWKQIAKHFDYRSEFSIKNRFFYVFQKKKIGFYFTAEDLNKQVTLKLKELQKRRHLLSEQDLKKLVAKELDQEQGVDKFIQKQSSNINIQNQLLNAKTRTEGYNKMVDQQNYKDYQNVLKEQDSNLGIIFYG